MKANQAEIAVKQILAQIKSPKGIRATWKKDGSSITILMPYQFKPTIAKFPEIGEFTFFVDFEKNEVGELLNVTFPHQTYPDGRKGETKKFNDIGQAINFIRKKYSELRSEAISKFNSGPANTWHYEEGKIMKKSELIQLIREEIEKAKNEWEDLVEGSDNAEKIRNYADRIKKLSDKIKNSKSPEEKTRLAKVRATAEANRQKLVKQMGAKPIKKTFK